MLLLNSCRFGNRLFLDVPFSMVPSIEKSLCFGGRFVFNAQLSHKRLGSGQKCWDDSRPSALHKEQLFLALPPPPVHL